MTRRLLPALLATLGLTAPAAAAEVSYSKDIKPFLANYCAECHTGPRARAGVSVDSYASLFRGRATLVVAGQPDRSTLLRCMDQSTARKIMPPRKTGKRPTADEIAMIKAWIAAGAKDDSNAAKTETTGEARKEAPPPGAPQEEEE